MLCCGAWCDTVIGKHRTFGLTQVLDAGLLPVFVFVLGWIPHVNVFLCVIYAGHWSHQYICDVIVDNYAHGHGRRRLRGSKHLNEGRLNLSRLRVWGRVLYYAISCFVLREFKRLNFIFKTCYMSANNESFWETDECYGFFWMETHNLYYYHNYAEAFSEGIWIYLCPRQNKLALSVRIAN